MNEQLLKAQLSEWLKRPDLPPFDARQVSSMLYDTLKEHGSELPQEAADNVLLAAAILLNFDMNSGVSEAAATTEDILDRMRAFARS